MASACPSIPRPLQTWSKASRDGRKVHTWQTLPPKPACLVSNPALPLPNFISLGKLLNFSVPQFLTYKNFSSTLSGFSELIHTKLIEQCLHMVSTW